MLRDARPGTGERRRGRSKLPFAAFEDSVKSRSLQLETRSAQLKERAGDGLVYVSQVRHRVFFFLVPRIKGG